MRGRKVSIPCICTRSCRIHIPSFVASYVALSSVDLHSCATSHVVERSAPTLRHRHSIRTQFGYTPNDEANFNFVHVLVLRQGNVSCVRLFLFIFGRRKGKRKGKGKGKGVLSARCSDLVFKVDFISFPLSVAASTCCYIGIVDTGGRSRCDGNSCLYWQ